MNKDIPRPFCEVEIGKVFEYEGSLYLKIEQWKVFSLSHNQVYDFDYIVSDKSLLTNRKGDFLVTPKAINWRYK